MNNALGNSQASHPSLFSSYFQEISQDPSDHRFTPTALIALINQTLEYTYDQVLLEGEVSSFKVNQGKWVFFDLKDETSSISCFMPVWELKVPIEDGMKVVARGLPKLTKWGKFSFTVKKIAPSGEGSLKKAYELLKKKLASEGLFDPAKKRPLPTDLTRLGVISSTQAAGYADFIKILNARWGGIKITVAHTQVQGLDAPEQIVRALNHFNEQGEVQVIAILRGGGSADDLACFNDESLVRAVAASKIPIICGIGHEIDESLCDLAADFRASTPSNAAELLTHDRREELNQLHHTISRLTMSVTQSIENAQAINANKVKQIAASLNDKYIEPTLSSCRQQLQQIFAIIQKSYDDTTHILNLKLKLLAALNPEKVLSQGYAILSGKISPGSVVKITTSTQQIKAEIKEIHDRKKIT